MINILTNLASVLQWSDLIDVFIVAAAIYLVIIFIYQSRSYSILYTVVMLAVVYYLAQNLNLGLTRQLIQPILTFFLVIFVIVFQKEIRRFFEWFTMTGRRLTLDRKISLSGEMAKTIADTAFELAQKKIGAIFVLPGDYPLEGMMEGGFSLDGKISRQLLMSIFDTSSPGHDGAVIIDNNRVRRFGVHLPLAETFRKFSTAGTRHRATAGITERSDALAIVVSEERGLVSVSEAGELEELDDRDQLEGRILSFMKENLEEETRTASVWGFLLTKHFIFKLIAVALALVFWFIFVYQSGTVNEEFMVPIEARFLPKDFVIDQVAPKEIKVVLSGNFRDLHDLDIQQDLKVFADVSKPEVGWYRVVLNEDNLRYPPFVTLVSISPRTINFNLRKTETANLPVINNQ